MRLLFAIIFALWATAAAAGTLHSDCVVFGVPDGDSLKIQCADRKSAMSARLAEIDAPEIAHPALHILEQPGGQESRAALVALCLKQPAVVHAGSIDRYGRTVARVECNGVDVNAEQVRTGHAWAYLFKKGSQMPALQAAAQAAGLGLWALPDPVKPSVWRKRTNGGCPSS